MVASLAIHHLRAQLPAQVEPVAARLALQSLAAELDDALPRSLPPQALLWLRRVAIAVPLVALRRAGAARGEAAAQGREQLDAALARAARPALGPVPPDAVAVLFADEAEMLACLALAAQAGQLDRWWWRGLLGARWPAWTLAWEERPWAQAGAQRLLVRAGRASAVSGVHQPHASPVPAAWPQAAGATLEEARSQAGRTASAAGGVAMALLAEAGDPVIEPPPWHERVLSRHASGAGGRPQGRPSPPARGRSPAAVDVPPEPGAHQRSAPASAAPVPEAVRASAESHAAARGSAPSSRPAPRRTAGAQREGRPSMPGRALAEAAAAPSIQPLSAPFGAKPGQSTPGVAPAPSAAAEAGHPQRPSAVGPGTEPAAQLLPQRRAEPAAPGLPADERLDELPAWPWPEALVSHQGALLFLVNALLDDGLYPDFTRPLDPGLPVPIGALLAALAQTWRLPPDPLQALFVAQAGDWQPARLAADLPGVPGVAPAPWARWLPAYARSLRGRLCRRLGLPPRRWRAALHRERPCRVWVSMAAWDVVFDLADHDVAWRLAGLDRDPGWLPSADLQLRFSFT